MKVRLLVPQVVFWIFLATCSPSTAAPFRIVVLGDSILWGQGLCDDQKIHNLVANSLQDCLGQSQFEFKHLARSGAIIGEASDMGSDPTMGPADYGEIPDPYPTVRRQCLDFNEWPSETVDLVIVDGGANDVGGDKIVNPGVPAAEISTGITNYCYLRMTNLLEDVSAKFRNATIVVTGYYPIVSGETPVTPMTSILSGVFPGFPNIITAEMKATMVAKSAQWAADSAVMFRRAVEEANTRNQAFTNRANRVVFADPRFGPENALLASQTWLYALSLPLLQPQDCTNVIAARIAKCEVRFPPSAPCQFTNFPPCGIVCVRASAFHPTPKGEQAYADAVFAAYLGADGLAWVQFGASCDPAQRCGTKWNPFGTLAAGVAGVPYNGAIAIRAGNSPGSITITNRCRLVACGGPVTIGR